MQDAPPAQLLLVVGAVIVVLLVVAGAVTGDGGGSQSDAYSADACREFRDAAADARDGVLTDAEFRQRMQTVRDDARNARPELHAAATELLAVVTRGDFGPSFDAAVRQLGDECRKDGH